jgi:type IV pilus assembly protein PilC
MIDISTIRSTGHQSSDTIRTGTLLSKQIRLFPWKMNDKRKERFYNELKVLLTAGLDIRASLELLHSDAATPEESKLYGLILANLDSGLSFAESIEKTNHFTTYEYYSLRIGEETGSVIIILNDLSDYYKKKIKQKRKLSGALSYPLIVIVIALLAVIFMLRFVVPMFADMLSRFNTELPALTKYIIEASGFLGDYSLPLLLVFVGAATLGWSQRKKVWFRKASANFVMRLPFVGRLTQKIYLERFTHSMQLLLSAKTNLIDSLDLVSKMVGYYPLETSLETIRKDILTGSSLHASMGKYPVYPKRLISLIRVAEESNQLDKMFGRISVQLTEELEHETTLLGSVIEPFMILFLGIMVAVILVAMYLPMFKLGTAFG